MATEKPAAAAAEMEEKVSSNEASVITLRVTDLVVWTSMPMMSCGMC